MDEIDTLIAQIQSTRRNVWVAGPQPESAIVELERVLGFALPPSLRRFVARFGGLGVGDNFISGVIDAQPLAMEAGSLYGDTLRFREEFELPKELLVVQADEDAPHCLNSGDIRSEGEFAVVCFELHSGHCQTISPSFGEWLVEWLRLETGDPL